MIEINVLSREKLEQYLKQDSNYENLKNECKGGE
jgi:hypothetical protein